jgi:hypothetical protein
MGVTTAKSLLRIMAVRQGMQIGGITHPPSAVVNATNELVERLISLDPMEAIDVHVVAEHPIHAQYIRTKTGELLAEIKAEQLLPADIERKLAQDYSVEHLMPVSRSIATYQGPERDRVIRCVVHLSAGDPTRISHFVGVATTDYRDVIVSAEYDGDGKQLHDFNRPFP